MLRMASLLASFASASMIVGFAAKMDVTYGTYSWKRRTCHACLKAGRGRFRLTPNNNNTRMSLWTSDEDEEGEKASEKEGCHDGQDDARDDDDYLYSVRPCAGSVGSTPARS